jgi:hypothetical protein
MKVIATIAFSLILPWKATTQPVVKHIDSLVKIIESKRTLTVNVVADTFPIAHSNLLRIERLQFYSTNNKLAKVISSRGHHAKDSTVKNIQTRFDVFYFNNDILIKVISNDFDQSPPANIQFYLNETHRKKFLSKATKNFSKYEGANYFIESGYTLLNEFKLLNQKVSK